MKTLGDLSTLFVKGIIISLVLTTPIATKAGSLSQEVNVHPELKEAIFNSNLKFSAESQESLLSIYQKVEKILTSEQMEIFYENWQRGLPLIAIVEEMNLSQEQTLQLQQIFQQSNLSTIEVAFIPEPSSTLALSLVSILGLILICENRLKTK